MSTVLASGRELSGLRDLNGQVHSALGRIEKLVRYINKTFESESIFVGSGSLQIAPVEGSSTEFSVLSNISVGRITLASEIVSGKYVCAVTVWRQTFDAAGEPIWQEVWKLYQPAYEALYFLDGTSQVSVSLDSMNAGDRVFELGLTIIVRLLGG